MKRAKILTQAPVGSHYLNSTVRAEHYGATEQNTTDHNTRGTVYGQGLERMNK